MRLLGIRPQRLALLCGILAPHFFGAAAAAVAGGTQRAGLQPRTPSPTPQAIGGRQFRNPQEHYLAPRQLISTDGTTTIVELPTGVISVNGQPLPTSDYGHDPLLALMPDFAFSMPAQIVVTGINIALVAVLVTHLLFTVQYHFPLSRKNFNLQMSSSLMILISLSVTLHIIFSQLESKSQTWPYMFPYIGVQVPPGDDSWTVVQEVFYLLMRAITTALIHITHIQFLTLLFPSALEARLILWMLGPLAIINSGMEFTALSSEDDLKTSDLGDAIRNICNSTLTLLYTSALLIWGVLVNRRRAWRAGGGTAAFGGGSVGLAIVNTAISFIEIKYDRLWWLPNICWTLTIWQSWLGFWWWVSSGMGIGEVEDRQERLEKKRKRELRRRRKAERQRRKAAGFATDDDDGGAETEDGGGLDTGSTSRLSGIRRLKDRMIGDGNASTIVRRPRRATGTTEGDGEQDFEHIELRQVRIAPDEVKASRRRASGVEDGRDAGHGLQGVSVVEGRDGAEEAVGRHDGIPEDARTTAGTGSGSSDTNPTTAASSAPPGWLGLAAQRLMEKQPNFIKARFRRLRLAHVAAARRAATEQSALREQVLNSSRNGGPGLRQMMFDRPASVRGAETDTAPVSMDRPRSASRSRRNSNAIRSSSIGARVADDGISAGRRLSRTNRLPDESTNSSSGAPTTSQESTAVRHQLAHIICERRSISNDTSTTRISPRTTLSGSGSSLQANSPDSSDFSYLHHPHPYQRQQSLSLGPTIVATRRVSRHERNVDPFSNRAAVDSGRGSMPTGAAAVDEEWIDEDPPSSASPVTQRADASRGRDDPASEAEGSDSADPSWFWRGGLRQMRLRDRTLYD
ncbi:hypothetical protein ACQY0O_000320 [Thecaphora frezii]